MKVFSLQDEKFEEMQTALNVSLVDVAKKIARGEFEQGDITLKIKLGTVPDFNNETPYKMPAFNFKVNTNLQKKSSLGGGGQYDDMEFAIDESGCVGLKRVQSAQMDMLEDEE